MCDDFMPSLVLSAAVQWKDAAWVGRCLSQPVIDAFFDWKRERLTSGDYTALLYESLIFRVAQCGAEAVEAALRRGLRFARGDTFMLHGGDWWMGPVAALAVVAARLKPREKSEAAALGAVACLLIELDGDDPDALVFIDGQEGGWMAMQGLAANPKCVLAQVTDEFWAPLRAFFAKRAGVCGWCVGR